MQRVRSAVIVGPYNPRCTRITAALERAGWICAAARDGLAAARLMRELRPSAILLCSDEPATRRAWTSDLRKLPYAAGVRMVALTNEPTPGEQRGYEVDGLLSPDADWTTITHFLDNVVARSAA